jgi:catechol-2,3-dioxygenase
MAETTTETRTGSHLAPKMLSHGTVETHDIEEAKRFYSEFLGMEVAQTSAISLMLRLNSTTTIACVQTKGETAAGMFSHFGFDYETREEVDAAYETARAQKDNYGIRKITRPVDQHGTYSFYIVDFDGNWWEILTNPEGGYSYVFDLEDESRSWRTLDRGKDRIKGRQEGKSDA